MTVAEDDDTLVARGNLAEDACGDEEGDEGREMKACGGFPRGFALCESDDDKADRGADEEGPSKRSRRRKVRDRTSEGGL